MVSDRCMAVVEAARRVDMQRDGRRFKFRVGTENRKQIAKGSRSARSSKIPRKLLTDEIFQEVVEQ